MNKIFFDPQTKLLRSGWRVIVFIIFSPFLFGIIAPLFLGDNTGSETTTGSINIDLITIIAYVVQVFWMIAVSWVCLKYFEHLGLAALGFGIFPGWCREIILGIVIAFLMIAAVVGLQIVSGGTRMMLNPVFWKSTDGVRSLDFIGVGLIFRDLVLGFLLFGFAAAFEELAFRGYLFQTLLRAGISPVIPIILLSLFFGLVHLKNPSSTIFSTINTILAGIWLSVAFLKTRRLWFPTALHLGWNWTMGIFFGLPVSGLKLSRYPIFLSTSQAPNWVTGAGYGSEGGAAATLILLLATLIIWKAKWLRINPETMASWQPPEFRRDETINLKLVE